MSRSESACAQNNNHNRSDEKEKTLKLLITQQPSKYVFCDEWFGVGLDLSSSYPPDVPAAFIELCCNLHRYTDNSIHPEPAQDNQTVDLHLLVQQPPVEVVNGGDISKPTIANCKIRSPLPADDKPIQYCLKFYYRSRQTGAIFDEVEQACSIPGKKLIQFE